MGWARRQTRKLLFLLMAQYTSANRQAGGAEFFLARLKEFEPRLTDVQKALYLSASALLRAQYVSAVSLLHRVHWVNETIAMLDRAKQLSGGKVFVVNWITGTIHAQLPNRFHQKRAEDEELQWCVENVEKAPHPAWLREVHYQLARLAAADGANTKSQEYLRRSGYTDFNKPIVLITPFSEDTTSGHAFSPRRIKEIVPSRFYALSGFEFTEYYFVVSRDRHEFIAIDAGTRPDFAKGAYEALRAYAPGVPPLTTVLITSSLSPRPRFYGRENYEELERQFNAPETFARQFFGERFSFEDLRSYKPDVAVDKRTDLTIGGSKFELIPARGGERHDGMLIYVPTKE
jgi:hypothetical protein